MEHSNDPSFKSAGLNTQVFQTTHSTDVSVLTEEGAEPLMCAGTTFNVSRTYALMILNEK